MTRREHGASRGGLTGRAALARHLLHPVDPTRGLVRADFATIRTWAEANS